MRIALLSDIHGNPIALDAVIRDIQAQGGVDMYWILGDMAAIGYDPVGVLQRLTELPDVHFVRGNTERYVVKGDRPGPTLEEAQADLVILQQLVDVNNSFSWTQGVVTVTEWFEWMASLPIERRMELPDGTRLLGVHASPGRDGGRGIRPDVSDAELQSLLAGRDSDLLCVGHTHWPMDFTVEDMRIVNLGSVSNPLPPDLRASYVILEAGKQGYQIQHRLVDYDHQAVIAAVKQSHHPAGKYIISHMLGQRQPPWTQK
jgi:predicted phosphodiesterase